MDSIITPQDVVKNYLARRGITLEALGVAPSVVVSWGRNVIKSLAEQTSAKLSEHWFYGERNPLYTGSIAGVPVSLIQLPVGSPGTVMIMEELIACGARSFIGLGWAGSLRSDIQIGSMIVPTICVSEEGTSLHYLDEEVEIVPDPGLVARFAESGRKFKQPLITGPIWTTDAPYRELRNKVIDYREQGVIGVDMETSAMYALGMFYNIPVCNLLVVSDILGESWDDGFGTEHLVEATQTAQKIVLDTISRGI